MLRACLVLLSGGCLVSCHGTASLPPGAPGIPAACVLTGASGPSATLTVALTEPVDPAHAPVPRNDSERMVFRQLYETLVGVDCQGNVRPALAESWSVGTDGRVWTLRLRSDARFTDGSALTARDVAASWQRAARVIQSVTISGDHELVVELASPAPSARLFASPDLAIARTAARGPWPEGSGAFRVLPGSDARVIRIASATRSVEFRSIAQAEPRSALDAGTDLLVSHDARVAEYARARSDYAVTPLPWSRTYVIFAGSSVSVPRDELDALAREAVRTEARPAEPPFWWTEPACLASYAGSGASRPAPTRRTIAYSQEDVIARAIAERLVSLAWPATSAPQWLRELLPIQNRSSAPSALGLDRSRFVENVRIGSTLAILPLPRAPRGECPVESLVLGDGLMMRLFEPGTSSGITPLIDTQPYLIHRRESGAVAVAGDGTLLFGEAVR